MLINNRSKTRYVLDELYGVFAFRYLSTSMLSIPHYWLKYCGDNIKEIEVMAFLSAIYDFQMRVSTLRNNFLNLCNVLIEENLKLRDLMDRDVYLYILDKVLKRIRHIHRFDPEGLAIPWIIRAMYNLDLEEKVSRSSELDRTIITSIWNELSKYLDKMSGLEKKRVRNILPRPWSKSPFKRINLFLRWVVRDEYPDLGLWRSIDKSILKIPLGLEIARVGGRVFFGKDLEKNSVKDMELITKILRRINPLDPIKYDFVLSRPALLGICLSKQEYSHCWACPLKNICVVGSRVNRYSNVLYTSLKEPLERRGIRKMIKIHNLAVKKLLAEISNIINYQYTDCRSDYAINHGLRPDIYCIDTQPLIGEVKVYAKYRQGPMQLKAYAEELYQQGLRNRPIGIIAYININQEDLQYINEAIQILNLRKYYKTIHILKYDYNKNMFKIIYNLKSS